jgi:hypothetical protein
LKIPWPQIPRRENRCRTYQVCPRWNLVSESAATNFVPLHQCLIRITSPSIPLFV